MDHGFVDSLEDLVQAPVHQGQSWFEPKPASMKTEPTSPLTVQGLAIFVWSINPSQPAEVWDLKLLPKWYLPTLNLRVNFLVGLVRWDPIPESGTQSYQTSPEKQVRDGNVPWRSPAAWWISGVVGGGKHVTWLGQTSYAFRHTFLCKYLSHQDLYIMTWSIEYIPSQLTTSCEYELFLQLLVAPLLKFDSELVRRILPHLLFAWAIRKEVTPNPADRGGPETYWNCLGKSCLNWMERASLSTRSPIQRACKFWENGKTSQIPDCRNFDGSSAETFPASFKRPVSFRASVIPLILVSLRERTFKTCWVALPTCSMPCSNWPSMFLMFSRLKRFSRDSCKAPDWYLRTKDSTPLLVAGGLLVNPWNSKKPLLRCWVTIACIHVYFYVHVF